MKYRVGRKQGRVILDENSKQVAICEIGQEAVAQRLCDLLNEHGLEKNLNLHSVSESSLEDCEDCEYVMYNDDTAICKKCESCITIHKP